MNQEKIGIFIYELRKDKDMTQEELANKLGVSNKTVSRWERGVNLPDLSLLKAISKELDVSLIDLLNGERTNNNIDEVEKTFINYNNYKLKDLDIEPYVKYSLIILTFLSLIITTLNMTYQVYQMNNIDQINSILLFINSWPLFTINILVIILAIVYIVAAIKSKKDVILKISFSIFSIITTMIVFSLIINIFAIWFNIL